jgi:hypothetical protein
MGAKKTGSHRAWLPAWATPWGISLAIQAFSRDDAMT